MAAIQPAYTKSPPASVVHKKQPHGPSEGCRSTRLGWAAPSTVRLSIGNHTLATSTDASGQLEGRLLPPTSAGGPYTPIVEAENMLKLEDVLFARSGSAAGSPTCNIPRDTNYQEADSAWAKQRHVAYV